MEDYVKTFESWLFEEENKKNVMESEIPWATADTKRYSGRKNVRNRYSCTGISKF